jgi:hypothetical protein
MERNLGYATFHPSDCNTGALTDCIQYRTRGAANFNMTHHEKLHGRHEAVRSLGGRRDGATREPQDQALDELGLHRKELDADTLIGRGRRGCEL